MADSERSGFRIGAALFNGDHARLADEVARLEEAGVDFIHLDVFDGRFVSDLGFPPRTIAALRGLTDLPFEVHLGAEDPLRFVPALVDAGADLIIFHVESVPMVYEALFLVRSQAVRAGLAFALGTPVQRLEPVIGGVDAVLLLSRVTGEGRARGELRRGRVAARIGCARHGCSGRLRRGHPSGGQRQARACARAAGRGHDVAGHGRRPLPRPVHGRRGAGLAHAGEGVSCSRMNTDNAEFHTSSPCES